MYNKTNWGAALVLLLSVCVQPWASASDDDVAAPVPNGISSVQVVVAPAATKTLKVLGATYVNATHVNVTFNRALDPTTSQRAANYVVTPALAATAAVLDANATVVHLTTGTQSYGVTYRVTVSNVRSSAGALVASGARTASWTVPTAPTVISGTPTGTGVSTLATITVTFSTSMSQSSAQSAFSISPAIGGSFSWSANAMRYTTGGLAALTTYRVTVATTARSAAGINMAASYSWAFTTGAVSQIIRVACVGDSITANTEYPADLQNLLGPGYDVGNYGHGGASVQHDSGRPYMDMPEFTAAQQFQPNIVLIMLGTNDTWIPDYHLTSFVTDYTTIAATFRGLASHPTVWCVLPPPIYANTYGLSNDSLLNGVIPLIQQVSITQGLPRINVYTYMANQPGLFSDGVHPNSRGALIMANVIYQAIKN